MRKSGYLNSKRGSFDSSCGQPEVNFETSCHTAWRLNSTMLYMSVTGFMSTVINDLCTLLREQCGDGIFITPDVEDIFCLMYADDVANCAETRVRLQRQINLIGEFCNIKEMKVNLNKTEIIVFRNGGPLRNYERWTLEGTPNIRTTSEYKYMGLIFTPKLSWSKAKRKLAAQARKAVFCIRNYQRKFGYFKHEEYFRLFDSMVSPILCFGLEVWGMNILA